MIRQIACIVLGLVSFAMAAPSTAPASQPAPAELAAARDEAIGMLQKKAYEAMLERFIDPATKAKILEREKITIKQLAEEFGKNGKAEKLAAVLEESKAMNVKLSEDGSKATYERDGRPLVWVKVNGTWYIGD